MPARLIVISGPSGAGKSTLTKRALERVEGCAVRTVSATTRSPRPGEVEGVDYEFLGAQEFQEAIKRGYFLEWAEYAGNFYGTPLAQVDLHVSRGISPVLEIEVQGAMKVRERYPTALMIWVRPPSVEELERRLRSRESERNLDIRARLEAAKRDESFIDRYEYVVENDILERAVQELVNLIKQHGCGR